MNILKRILAGCFWLSISIPSVFAQPLQPCNDELIMAINGKWTKRPDGSGIPAQAIVRLEKMQSIVQAAYAAPKGIEPRWYQPSTKNPLFPNGPQPYQLTSGFFEYYCNKNVQKMRLAGETGTWFYIYTNQFKLFVDEDIFFSIQYQPVYRIRKKTGEIRGFPVYEGMDNRNTNTGHHYSRAIIITRNGQMPYLVVTKKEYLTAYLERLKKENPKHLALFEKMPQPSSAADKQRRAEDLERLKKLFEDQEKPARDLLSILSESEGSTPAIVDDNYADQFKGFVPEEKGGRILVRLNPSYFDLKLPKYMPQFLIAYWMCDLGTPQNYWREQVEKNIDLNALQSLLDK
ncbi:MAG TPA: hypothetical protein VLJ68_02125 [Chitinophagaceae bacterium]|nr:hypothetical protein [Chitinophagaceae bacterium]